MIVDSYHHANVEDQHCLVELSAKKKKSRYLFYKNRQTTVNNALSKERHATKVKVLNKGRSEIVTSGEL